MAPFIAPEVRPSSKSAARSSPATGTCLPAKRCRPPAETCAAAFVIHTVGPSLARRNAGRERHPGLGLPQLAAAGRPAGPAFGGLSRDLHRGIRIPRRRLRRPWRCATVIDELTSARSVHEARFVLFGAEMLSIFIQAAKDEQRRRNAIPLELSNPRTQRHRSFTHRSINPYMRQL